MAFEKDEIDLGHIKLHVKIMAEYEEKVSIIKYKDGDTWEISEAEEKEFTRKFYDGGQRSVYDCVIEFFQRKGVDPGLIDFLHDKLGIN